MITEESACIDLKKAIETLDMDLMKNTIRDALDSDVSIDSLLENGITPAMDIISDGFDKGILYLPQLLSASHVVDEAMNLLFPIDKDEDQRYRGTVVMGTVSGDIHEIGKNLCCALLRGAGYKVIDLGSDVSPDDFANAARKNGADIVGGSSLMTTTLEAQKRTVSTLRESDCEVITMFGGAPCSQEWVDSIEGDCYSASGHEMVKKANDMMLKKNTD